MKGKKAMDREDKLVFKKKGIFPIAIHRVECLLIWGKLKKIKNSTRQARRQGGGHWGPVPLPKFEKIPLKFCRRPLESAKYHRCAPGKFFLPTGLVSDYFCHNGSEFRYQNLGLVWCKQKCTVSRCTTSIFDTKSICFLTNEITRIFVAQIYMLF